MKDPKVYFCIFLTILIAILLWWSWKQNNSIGDLSKQNLLLQSTIVDIEKTNNLLKNEVTRIKEFAEKHHEVTDETKKKNQELIDEINLFEKDNKIWFDGECPPGLDCVLSKGSN